MSDPCLTPIVSLALMLSLPGATWLRLFAWMGVGVAIYFASGYRRSRQGLSARLREAPQSISTSTGDSRKR